MSCVLSLMSKPLWFRFVRVREWEKYPDRTDAIDFLVERIKEYQYLLRSNNENSAENYDSLGDDTNLSYLESGVCNGLSLLAKMNEFKTVHIIVELLTTCIECEYRISLSYCMDALIEFKRYSLDLVIDRYNSNKGSGSHCGIWLEIMAKPGIKDKRIRKIIENHFSINRYEAILATGDYKDDYFIPVVEDIVKQSAEYLVKNNLDPFQKFVRVWNRYADIYIEARTVLIELANEISVDSKEYLRFAKEMDSHYLSHIDIDTLYLYRKHNRSTLTDQQYRHYKSNFSNDQANLRYDEYLFCCLKRVIPDIPGAHDIPYIFGFLWGCACCGKELSSIDLFESTGCKMDSFDDESHIMETHETLTLTYNYNMMCLKKKTSNSSILKCIKNNSGTGHLRGQTVCRVIEGFIEGIDELLINKDMQSCQTSNELYHCIQDINNWISRTLDKNMRIKPN